MIRRIFFAAGVTSSYLVWEFGALHNGAYITCAVAACLGLLHGLLTYRIISKY